jgi:hypothetical protein
VLIVNSKVTQKGESTKATKTIKTLSVTNTSNVENKEKTTLEEKRLNPRADGTFIGRK